LPEQKKDRRIGVSPSGQKNGSSTCGSCVGRLEKKRKSLKKIENKRNMTEGSKSD
jgi:hypothetical protein